MTFQRIATGKKGERIAANFLKQQGYEIIIKNYKTKYGEIDIICRDRGYICFIEVRSSNSSRFNIPEYTITKRKQYQISKAALSYIKRFGLEKGNSRFDVVCIEDVNSDEPKVRLIKNAFELDISYRY
ncbi:MAG: YraN family protein [Candidatus Omnitrophota bacterium]|nr:YraN family protein [Candidatus Omnitrophota bacterium]